MKKINLVFVFLLITLSIGSCKSDNNANFDSNYAHVVYFWFHNPDSAEDKAFFEKSLKKFLNNSKYAKTNFIGVAPAATRDVVDDSYDYNIILTFESAEAQDKYQTEDVHLQFVKESEHLWKKVIVYDAISISN